MDQVNVKKEQDFRDYFEKISNAGLATDN